MHKVCFIQVLYASLQWKYTVCIRQAYVSTHSELTIGTTVLLQISSNQSKNHQHNGIIETPFGYCPWQRI